MNRLLIGSGTFLLDLLRKKACASYSAFQNQKPSLPELYSKKPDVDRKTEMAVNIVSGCRQAPSSGEEKREAIEV